MLVIAVSGFEKKKTNNDQEKCLPIIHNKQRNNKQKNKKNKTTKTIQNRKESELKIYKYLFFLFTYLVLH